PDASRDWLESRQRRTVKLNLTASDTAAERSSEREAVRSTCQIRQFGKGSERRGCDTAARIFTAGALKPPNKFGLSSPENLSETIGPLFTIKNQSANFGHTNWHASRAPANIYLSIALEPVRSGGRRRGSKNDDARSRIADVDPADLDSRYWRINPIAGR